MEHAGFKRFILSQNPKRYDYWGDELEDDEVDETADAARAEIDPYSEIKIESEDSLGISRHFFQLTAIAQNSLDP